MDSLSNLRIVFLTGMLGPGGAERQLYYILTALQNLGAEIHVISLTSGEYWEKPILELGIPVRSVDGQKNRWTKLVAIICHLKKIKPVLIQSQHFYVNLYSAIAGRFLNMIDIGAIRGNGSYEVSQNGAFFGRLSLYMPRYLAVNSLAGKGFAESLWVSKKRLRILPNVIDDNKFKPVNHKSLNGIVTLLLVANLELRVKRVDVFIKVLCQLTKATQSPFRAIIVGDGSLKSELIDMARACGIFPGILDFVGTSNHVEDYYSKSDILVLTSDSEGTPNVVLEALSSGLPVVATKVGGVPDVVEDGKHGFLIEPGDVSLFVDRLVTLIENSELRNQMGKMGREHILTNHSLEKLPIILSDFYASIIK